MKINVGSTNLIKVGAVSELLAGYPEFKNAEVSAIDTISGVSDQPKSLEETVKGAMNRAKLSFNNCSYSLGIESGLMSVPETHTGFMDVCVCAIYDGKDFHLGLSSAWEPPKRVVHYMINEGLNMNDAGYKAGLTNNKKIGSAEGVIGIVSNGKLTRKEYTKEAIRTALIKLSYAD